MKSKTTVEQLLKLIPEELLSNIEQETKVNHQVKKLRWTVMFKLLLMSVFDNERASLRLMEDIYNSERFRQFRNDWDVRKTKHSSLSDRLKTINFKFFKKIFEFLFDKFKNIISLKENIRKLDIQRFDSTFVWLSTNLLKIWMKHWWSNKTPWNINQIKFTVWINNLFPNTAEVFTETKDMSENIALRQAIINSSYKKDWIIVFDRWLQKRLTFKEFDDEWIKFVTRLNCNKNRNARYKIIKQFKNVKWRKTNTWLELQEDLIVNLYDKKSRIIRTPFRLIKAKNLDKNKKDEYIYFLTNITNLNAREITDIYKRRWDIEVFFRFIKQELNFKHFISRTLNWIKVMMYMTLIASILLIAYKHNNKIQSYKTAKFRFKEDLNMEITREIVLYCNWDISKFEELRKRQFY